MINLNISVNEHTGGILVLTFINGELSNPLELDEQRKTMIENVILRFMFDLITVNNNNEDI